MSNHHERETALMEAAAIHAEHGFYAFRQQLAHTSEFNAGFVRGWKAGRIDLAQPPLIDACRSFLRYCGIDQARADAAIATMREAVGAIVDADQHSMEEQSPQQGAPIAEREALRDAVAESMTDLYCCSRVWSAWQVGTMTQNDFSPAAEDGDILDNICDAVEKFLQQPKITEMAEERPEYCSVCGQLAYGPVLCCNEGRGLPMVAKTEARALLAGKESK